MPFSAAVCIPGGLIFCGLQSGQSTAANTGLQKLAVDCERDSLVGDRARQGDLCVLRVSLFVIAISMLFGASTALAAEPMAPNDIKATFFTGQPFTASSPSGAKFKMTFTPDGKMTREPVERRRDLYEGSTGHDEAIGNLWI